MSKLDEMPITERLARSRRDVWVRVAELQQRGYRIGDLIEWANHLCATPKPSTKAERMQQAVLARAKA